MAIADEPDVDAGVFFAEVKNELMLDVTEEEDETEEEVEEAAPDGPRTSPGREHTDPIVVDEDF